MGKNNGCCVCPCDNDKYYPGKIKERSHVVAMKWHLFVKNKEKTEMDSNDK